MSRSHWFEKILALSLVLDRGGSRVFAVDVQLLILELDIDLLLAEIRM